MKWNTTIIVILLIAAGVFATLYFVNPRVIEVPAAPDSSGTVVLKPDTVLIDTTIFVDRIVRDTVLTTENDTLILRDTLYIEGQRYTSVFNFRKEYLRLGINAYARCRVDSVNIDYFINFARYDSLYCRKPSFSPIGLLSSRTPIYFDIAKIGIASVGWASGQQNLVIGGLLTLDAISLTNKILK